MLKQSLFWVPQTGDFGMGVSIYSYAGEVQFGLITDAALTPDPEAVVSRFPEEFEKYLYYAENQLAVRVREFGTRESLPAHADRKDFAARAAREGRAERRVTRARVQ